MALPTPHAGETKEDFVSRCMEAMTKDESERFPSRAQRAAICYSQWNEYARKNSLPLDGGGAHKNKD